MKTDNKNICFRTKGSHAQGMGDVMGSLAIAEEFRVRGHSVDFIVDDNTKALQIVKKYKYKFTPVNKDENKVWDKKLYDAVIVNQLTTSYKQLSLIKQHSKKLVTIDDTGSASKKLADLRINPLYYGEGAICEPKYVPLHPIFQKAHKNKKIIKDSIREVLVTLGGSDTYGFTPQIIKALLKFYAQEKITLVLGPCFKHNEDLKRSLSSKKNRNFNIFRSVSIQRMAHLIESTDVAICGAGNTLFEMACCGTPVVAVASEPFEQETAFRLERMGFGKALPFNKQLDSNKLRCLLVELSSRDLRLKHSNAGKRLVDGKGIKRIVDMILN